MNVSTNKNLNHINILPYIKAQKEIEYIKQQALSVVSMFTVEVATIRLNKTFCKRRKYKSKFVVVS